MDVGIINKEAFTMVGIPVKANLNSLYHEIHLAWEQWFNRCDEVKSRASALAMGASLAVQDGLHFQLIGAQVEQARDIPDDMICIDIPCKQYIYAEHQGPVEAIADSFDAMYEWATAQGHHASHFKLDVGYTSSAREPRHQLYIEVLD